MKLVTGHYLSGLTVDSFDSIGDVYQPMFLYSLVSPSCTVDTRTLSATQMLRN